MQLISWTLTNFFSAKAQRICMLHRIFLFLYWLYSTSNCSLRMHFTDASPLLPRSSATLPTTASLLIGVQSTDKLEPARLDLLKSALRSMDLLSPLQQPSKK